MPPVPTPLPEPAGGLLDAYLAHLAAGERGNRTYVTFARSFLARWPDPQAWAAEPLALRLGANRHTRPLLSFLMLHGHLQPGYDYLLERKLPALLRELPTSPLGPQIDHFLAAAGALGYASRARLGMASQVAARLLIQTGRALTALTEADLAAFAAAVTEREQRHRRAFKHYRTAVYATRAVLYHLGAHVEPAAKDTPGRWSWEQRFDGVAPAIRAPMVAYLECCGGTRARSTVRGMASRLAHFGRALAAIDPAVASLANLDRQRHIEPWLHQVAQARHPRLDTPLSASERRSRILTVGRMLADVAEWGWAEAPARRLLFDRDVPKLPRPLPRYLPPDHDRALTRALEASPNRLYADALLLQRATGLRIGELCDLELDCVHEVAGQGAWLKVPLGKLDTERMVPLDEETVWLVDRIAEHRSPGRPLRHPRTSRLVEFLLTHQGRRVSVYALRDELRRAAAAAGIDPVTPHQLRHTYATALVNAGCSLQALMALLGHVSATMSLRYGRLFDATVRADYERALALAKQRLGPVLPEASPVELELQTDWRQAPLVKARLAGGYCLRTAAQGVCPYTNICEHCPNFRSDTTFLPVLATQRIDAEALARDAEQRGWEQEAARHRRLIERLDEVMSRAHTINPGADRRASSA
jgi:integrase